MPEPVMVQDRRPAWEVIGLLAWRLGLVTEVCADPLQCALELAARLASLPQLAVRVTGEVVDAMAARLPR